MKKIFIYLAVMMLTMAYMPTATAQDLGQTIPTVSVNGSAQLKITPDEIYIAIKLDETDSKGKVTLDEQRKDMFSALKKCGIDIEKQLSVTDMSSSFFRKRGSLAASNYELKVASADEARKVFEELDKNGIANVNITRATCSKMEEHRAEARKMAILNAQSRARELAEALGQTIGACYEINDYTTEARNYSTSRVMLTKSVAMADTTVEAAEPEIAFEQIVISYNVSAKFYLNTK
jgi:uncharacterized protein YggE